MIAGLVSVERMLPVCLALGLAVRSSVGAAAAVLLAIGLLRQSSAEVMIKAFMMSQ